MSPRTAPTITALLAAALAAAVAPACKKSEKTRPSTVRMVEGRPYSPPELEGPEPILIPPNAGRFLAYKVAAPTVNPASPKASVQVKLCADRDGDVNDVQVTQGWNAEVDKAVVEAARHWEHRPYTVHTESKAFCYVLRFTYTRGSNPAWIF